MTELDGRAAEIVCPVQLWIGSNTANEMLYLDVWYAAGVHLADSTADILPRRFEM